jgi:hypothetical protein
MRSIVNTAVCTAFLLLIKVNVFTAEVDLSNLPPQCVMRFGDRPEVFRREADMAYTTLAYELTKEQEEWFDIADNVPARFWRTWEAVPDAGQLYLDHNNPHVSSGEPVNSKEDANVTLRFAYGNKGLYVFFEVVDDDWAPVLTDASYAFWQFDVCDLYLSQYGANEMYSNAGEYFFNLRYSQFGLGTAQMLVSFGGNEPVDFFYYNVAGEPTKEDPGPSNFLSFNKSTFDDAKVTWGIEIEILPPQKGEENIRRQEWMIPWSSIGGLPGTTRRQVGDRLAFAGGYNDLDLTAIKPSRLRWRNGADPYYHCGGLQDDGTYEGRSIDSWGDILFDKKLDDLLADNNVQMPEGWSNNPTNGARHSLRQRSPRFAAAARLQHFTPGGRLIHGTARTNSGIAIERVTVNGKTVSRKRVVVLP